MDVRNTATRGLVVLLSPSRPRTVAASKASPSLPVRNRRTNRRICLQGNGPTIAAAATVRLQADRSRRISMGLATEHAFVLNPCLSVCIRGPNLSFGSELTLPQQPLHRVLLDLLILRIPQRRY